MQFEIVLGRITAKNACHGKARIATVGDVATGSGEVLTLRVMEGAPRIRYELCRDGERILVSANSADHLWMEHHLKDSTTVVRYLQTPAKNVSLSVQCGEEMRTISAPSLWHLWLRDPELCQTHLSPCLSVLRPQWNLNDEIEAIEKRLFAFRGPHFIPSDDEPLETDYPAWLKAMADDRYAVRQAATARFMKAGIAAKPFLDGLDMRHLDGEQRMRVRRLQNSLVFRTEDSANRIVSWLRDDRWFWFAHLNDRNSAKRRMAYAELKRICGDSLAYDPEAEADLRASQIAVLEQRVFR